MRFCTSPKYFHFRNLKSPNVCIVSNNTLFEFFGLIAVYTKKVTNRLFCLRNYFSFTWFLLVQCGFSVVFFLNFYGTKWEWTVLFEMEGYTNGAPWCTLFCTPLKIHLGSAQSSVWKGILADGRGGGGTDRRDWGEVVLESH